MVMASLYPSKKPWILIHQPDTVRLFTPAITLI